MDGNREIKVVWDENGECHCVTGIMIDQDEQFFIFRLRNGNELSIAKSRIIKIEKPSLSEVEV